MQEIIRRGGMGGIFYGAVGGVEYGVERGNKRGSREGDEEERIGRGEILGELRRLKIGKAAVIDGIPGDVWKYEGEELERWAEKLLDKI